MYSSGNGANYVIYSNIIILYTSPYCIALGELYYDTNTSH